MMRFRAKNLLVTLRLQRTQLLPLIIATYTMAGYVTYAAIRQRLIGVLCFVIAGLLLLLLSTAVRRYLGALLAASILLALTPLTTVPTLHAFLIVVTMMAGAVGIVYVISRYFEREQLVHLQLDWRRRWRRWELGYLLATLAVVYLLMPYYFTSTGAIHAWYFTRHTGEIAAVFSSTLIIGAWEEFFFTATVLGVLRKYLPFAWANSLQAIMFASFLYAVGFRYWAPFGMFCYAWAQGWVFQKTRSLLYVLIVHICVDFLVCLVLLHAYYPDLSRIFLT